MDEVPIDVEPSGGTEPFRDVERRIVLRPGVALFVGLLVGVGVGIAVAAALTKVAADYGDIESAAKHAASPAQVVIEDDD